MSSVGTAERTWDLTAIYTDDGAWKRDLESLERRIDRLESFRGRLSENAQAVQEVLTLLFDTKKLVERLYTYAALACDEDLRESEPRGLKQRIQARATMLAASSSWVDPELLAIPPARLAKFREDPGLKTFSRYLDKLESRREHTLDESAERVMGLSGMMRGHGETVTSLMTNADIPWPSVTLADGEELRVDAVGFSKGRRSTDRADRLQVYNAFFGQLSQYKGSMASALYATIREHVFESRARSFPSSLHSSLHHNEVDPSVYHTLIAEAREGLPILHRYMRLRRQMLDVDTLGYHDMYAPMFDEPKTTYDWDTSVRLVLDSCAPLGKEYAASLEHALTSRWVDVDPRPGKRSGAYLNDGAYDVHPYMLLNHQDDFNSASTLAHEAGHLMHSYLSQKNNPFPTARYVIFVAEVASTLNEQLMFHYLLERSHDPAARLALLGHHLESIRGVFFRQSMFAEFELAIHRAAEQDEPLTGDTLNEMYGRLLETYHGVGDKLMEIDPIFHSEWSYVPHFHYNFYVYQYSTSFVAATSLCKQILNDEPGATEHVLEFLSSGSKKKPLELLIDAGVDVSLSQPYRDTLQHMTSVMDQIEGLL